MITDAYIISRLIEWVEKEEAKAKKAKDRTKFIDEELIVDERIKAFAKVKRKLKKCL